MWGSERFGAGRWAGWGLSAALAAGVGAVAAPVGAAQPGGPVEGHVAVVQAVASWVAGEIALPATAPPPTIRLATPERLAALRHGEAVGHGSSEVVALYHDAERTIYLREGWTGRTPEERSVLVHEMVHHLQNASGARHACPAEREKAAYEAQADWLELFGADLAGAFEIDPMTRLVLTTCGM
jgi:hypothetical protein